MIQQLRPWNIPYGMEQIVTALEHTIHPYVPDWRDKMVYRVGPPEADDITRVQQSDTKVSLFGVVLQLFPIPTQAEKDITFDSVSRPDV